MFVAIRTYSHFHVVHLELVASLVVLYHVQASAPLLSPATSLSLFLYIEVKPLMHPRPKVHALCGGFPPVLHAAERSKDI